MINEDEFSEVYDQATVSGYLTDYDEDKYAAASAIWAEKAATLQADTYNLSADGASYEYHQKIENAWNMARIYASKRSPKTSLWTKSPEETIEYSFQEE